jgi:CheY-like chemotaxis protein
MNPGRKVRILSVCDHDSIRYSRELVLRQEGYEVESVTSDNELSAEWVRSFQIAILCHSIRTERAWRIAECLRSKNSDIRVLGIHAMCSGQDPSSDIECEVLSGPNALLQALEKLADHDLQPFLLEKQKRF